MFLNLQALSNTKYIDVNSWSSKQGPPMNEARYDHGCATASYKDEVHVFVVGGTNENGYSDSMEVFNVMEEKWINDFQNTILPVPLYDLQVVPAHSPEYFVYTVGGADLNGNSISTIYGLNKNKQWEKIGDLKTKRFGHATVNYASNDIPKCQCK